MVTDPRGVALCLYSELDSMQRATAPKLNYSKSKQNDAALNKRASVKSNQKVQRNQNNGK